MLTNAFNNVSDLKNCELHVPNIIHAINVFDKTVKMKPRKNLHSIIKYFKEVKIDK